MTNSINNQCAILKENANGVQVWAKSYSTGKQCLTIKLDPSEKKAYLVSNHSVLTLGVVDCSDGAIDTFVQINDSTLTVSQENPGIVISPDSTKIILIWDSSVTLSIGYVCTCGAVSFSWEWVNLISTPSYFDAPAASNTDYFLVIKQLNSHFVYASLFSISPNSQNWVKAIFGKG